jgi:hypothetical protein
MYKSPEGFRNFVRFLSRHGSGFDEHVRPLVSFFNADAGQQQQPQQQKQQPHSREQFVRVDLVADITHIDRVWPLVGARLGFDPPLLETPRLRQQEGGQLAAQRKIDVEYTPETLAMVHDV